MEKKKAAEGIALLSMYNDEEEEEEEEEDEIQNRMDVDPDDDANAEHNEDDAAAPEASVPISETISLLSQDDVGDNDRLTGEMHPEEASEMEEDVPLTTSFDTAPVASLKKNTTPNRSTTPTKSFFSPSPSMATPPVQTPSLDSLSLEVRATIRVTETRSSLAIVDYAHDDNALSPEPEDGEITGQIMGGSDLHSIKVTHHPTNPGSVSILSPAVAELNPSLLEEQNGESGVTLDSSSYEGAVADNNVEVLIDTADAVKQTADPLEKFLPQPPTSKCSEELQAKIIKFLGVMGSGRSFNEELRKSKEYRNPDFLQHAVRYQEIDEIGTCFDKDIFDPHGYDKSDYYDEIEADWKREIERKEQERKRNQKIDFAQGGLLPAPAVTAPKPQTAAPPSNVPAVSITLPSLHPNPNAIDALPKDGRQNKKSKWDKVDGDKIPMSTAGQDSVSSVGAHAALLSAANAGAGYSAYAQQKKREADERRSIEKRLEKRS